MLETERRKALLERAEQVAHIGSWEFDPESGDLFWSDNLFRIMGLEAEEITPTLDYLVEHTLPEDQDRVDQYLRLLDTEGGLGPFEYRYLSPDGAVRHLRSYAAMHGQDDVRPRLLVGAVQDITERRLAEREIAAHVAVSEALAEWDTFEQGAEGLLRSLATAMGCVGAVLWIPDGDVLVPRVLWHAASVGLSDFEALTLTLRFPRGCGLPGRVWEQRQPLAVITERDGPASVRRASAVLDRLRGFVALPALAGEEVVAVLELHSREETELTKRLMRSLTSIGHELGQFLRSRHGQIRPLPLTERELGHLDIAGSADHQGEHLERRCSHHQESLVRRGRGPRLGHRRNAGERERLGLEGTGSMMRFPAAPAQAAGALTAASLAMTACGSSKPQTIARLTDRSPGRRWCSTAWLWPRISARSSP